MARRSPRAAGVRSPAGSPRGKEQSTNSPDTSRRTFLGKAGTFIAGVVSGVLGSVGAGYVSAWRPPSEVVDAQSSDAPVRAYIVRERDQGLQGELWVYPGAVSTKSSATTALTSRVSTPEDRHISLYNEGYVDANITLIKLLVEGRRNTPVRIIDIRARILNRRPLSAGYSLLGPGPQGTGPSVALGFELDEDEPRAREVDTALGDPYSSDYFGGPFFAGANTELARGEQEVYAITARTFSADIEWELELMVSVAGRSEPFRLRLGDRGRALRTIGIIQNRDDEFPSPVSPDFESYGEVYGYQADGYSFIRSYSDGFGW